MLQRLKNFFHHLFIPNEKNNFKSKSLHHDFLVGYLLIALFLNFLFKTNLTQVLGFSTDITVEKLLNLTNKEREKYQLSPLKYNEKLSLAARKKAEDMFAKNYWAHYSPYGKTPWDFILDSGYQYEYAGENLAKNFLFTNDVIRAWMNSPSHKENILKKEYTDVGFAVVNGVLNNEETTLIVQIFAKPLTSNSFEKKSILNNNLLLPKTVQAKEVLPENKNTKNLIASKTFGFDINLLFFLFFLFALILDFYYAIKLNVFRISGKNLAHFIFIFFILIGLIIISKGKIL